MIKSDIFKSYVDLFYSISFITFNKLLVHIVFLANDLKVIKYFHSKVHRRCLIMNYFHEKVRVDLKRFPKKVSVIRIYSSSKLSLYKFS